MNNSRKVFNFYFFKMPCGVGYLYSFSAEPVAQIIIYVHSWRECLDVKSFFGMYNDCSLLSTAAFT